MAKGRGKGGGGNGAEAAVGFFIGVKDDVSSKVKKAGASFKDFVANVWKGNKTLDSLLKKSAKATRDLVGTNQSGASASAILARQVAGYDAHMRKMGKTAQATAADIAAMTEALKKSNQAAKKQKREEEKRESEKRTVGAAVGFLATRGASWLVEHGSAAARGLGMADPTDIRDVAMHFEKSFDDVTAELTKIQLASEKMGFQITQNEALQGIKRGFDVGDSRFSESFDNRAAASAILMEKAGEQAGVFSKTMFRLEKNLGMASDEANDFAASLTHLAVGSSAPLSSFTDGIEELTKSVLALPGAKLSDAKNAINSTAATIAALGENFADRPQLSQMLMQNMRGVGSVGMAAGTGVSPEKFQKEWLRSLFESDKFKSAIEYMRTAKQPGEVEAGSRMLSLAGGETSTSAGFFGGMDASEKQWFAQRFKSFYDSFLRNEKELAQSGAMSATTAQMLKARPATEIAMRAANSAALEKIPGTNTSAMDLINKIQSAEVTKSLGIMLDVLSAITGAKFLGALAEIKGIGGGWGGLGVAAGGAAAVAGGSLFTAGAAVAGGAAATAAASAAGALIGKKLVDDAFEAGMGPAMSQWLIQKGLKVQSAMSQYQDRGVTGVISNLIWGGDNSSGSSLKEIKPEVPTGRELKEASESPLSMGFEDQLLKLLGRVALAVERRGGLGVDGYLALEGA